MGAEWIYYGAICLIVFPSAAFNKMALLILLSWLAGHICVLGGMNAELANAIQHCTAGAIAFSIGRGAVCWMIASLFVPMTIVDMLRLIGLIDPLEAWRWVLCLALLQIVILPLGNDWRQIRATWRAYITNRTINRALERLSLC